MFPARELKRVESLLTAKLANDSKYNRMPCLARNGKRIHTTKAIISMNTQPSNNLSRLERDYISFLYDTARIKTNQTVTIAQIQEFINTPEGQKGFGSFKAMSKPVKQERNPQPIGAFL